MKKTGGVCVLRTYSDPLYTNAGLIAACGCRPRSGLTTKPCRNSTFRDARYPFLGSGNWMGLALYKHSPMRSDGFYYFDVYYTFPERGCVAMGGFPPFNDPAEIAQNSRSFRIRFARRRIHNNGPKHLSVGRFFAHIRIISLNSTQPC